MKYISFILLLITANASLAADDAELFDCAPVAGQPNGLGIEQLKMALSTENPDGMMKIKYEGRAEVGSLLDYEGDRSRYEITPSSHSVGDIVIVLAKRSRSWIATVTSPTIDTVSVLSCTEN